jgi:hypothetical protein
MPGFSYPDDRAGQREEEAPEKIGFEERWRQDIELAYGEMGLLPVDFLEMTPRDWIARKRGHFRKEEKRWEHTRLIVAALTGEKATSIIKLSSDIPDAASITTAEDVARILEKDRQRQERLNQTP